MISVKKVEQFFKDNNVEKKKDKGDSQIWKSKNVIIKIPKLGYMEELHFISIAKDQLNISDWDIDYFLGELDKSK